MNPNFQLSISKRNYGVTVSVAADEEMKVSFSTLSAPSKRSGGGVEAFVRWREEEVQPHYSVDRTTHRTTSLFLRSAPELSSFIEGATQRLEGREKITKRVH